MEWYVLRKKDNSKVWITRADKVRLGRPETTKGKPGHAGD